MRWHSGRSSVAGGLIAFVCGTKRHRRADHGLPSGETPLTIHEGQWAYCPGGAISEHEWHGTAPVGIDSLKLRYAGWVVAENPGRLDPHRSG